MLRALELWKLSPQPLDLLIPGMEQKTRVFIAVCNAHLNCLENIQNLACQQPCRCKVIQSFDQLINLHLKNLNIYAEICGSHEDPSYVTVHY